MKIAFAKSGLPKAGSLAVGVLDGGILSPTAQMVDDASGGTLARAISASRFSGKAGQTLEIIAPTGMDADRVIAIGLGKAEDIDGACLEKFAAAAYAAVEKAPATELTLAVDVIADTKEPVGILAAHAAFGAKLRSYRFDTYRTQEKPEDKPALKTVTVATNEVNAAEAAFAQLDAVAEGIFLTRDLVAEPANVLTPPAFMRKAKALSKDGIDVEVLDEKAMEKLGMGALLGVGQGSSQPSQLVIMRWNGGKKSDAPVAVVGKGVCFDSGGISIKPAAGMEEMKGDMGGAAVVTGLMKALAKRNAPVNVVGILGLVENMPSGTAQRPGDVVTSMSGQTIEVINTDAEGRLVLADALTYTQKTFKPQVVIDLATLTGAILIALGGENAGLFTNNDDLSQALTAAGGKTGETVWRMPMGKAYDEMIKSDIADMKNVGGREAGSITAAQFLQRFIQDDTPWAHIDIAGVSWGTKTKGTTPKGASGWGVRLLNTWIAETFETEGNAKSDKKKAAKK